MLFLSNYIFLDISFWNPGTPLEKRLARDDQEINSLDVACREHDITYSHSNDLTTAIYLLLYYIVIIVSYIVWTVMKAKTKFGMDLKTKKKKKSKLLIAKRSSVLPVLLLLGILGSLVAGAAGVAKVANDNKAAQRQKNCNVIIALWKIAIYLTASRLRLTCTIRMPTLCWA